jgi:Ca2+/Na+ antiporter
MFTGRTGYSCLQSSLKRDIYILAVLLLIVIFSNIIWVFIFPWFQHIASFSALIFVLVLFFKLRSRINRVNIF